MAWWMWLAGARAACPAPPEVVHEELDRLEAAPAGFLDAYSALQGDVHCLSAPATPDLAAKWHRLRALAAFTRRDQDGVVAAYRAAHETQPGYSLPAEVAPDGHPLRDLYARAAASDPAVFAPVDVPRRTRLVVDGTSRDERPVERDALIQQVHGDEVLWTRTVPAGDPLPSLVEVPRRGGWVWWTAAGTTAAASGGLWAASLARRAQLDDYPERVPSDVFEQARQDQRAANQLGYAAQATTGVALGLAVVAVVW